MTERRFPLSGEVDMSWSDELQKSLLVLVNETNDDIVVDCDGLEFIDSTGIAMIVRAWQRLAEGDGDRERVVICSTNEQVRRVLEITGLEVSIPVHESRDAALAALRGA